MVASLFEQRASFHYRTERGNFKCNYCERSFSTRGGRADHAQTHGEDIYLKERAALRCEEIADEKRKRLDKENEARLLQRRALRKVVLSTKEVDEIVAEMHNLINMMEPYWAQGNCTQNAEAIIEKLNAKANGDV